VSTLLAVSLALLPWPQDPVADRPEPLRPEAFRQLHRDLVPDTSEPWQQIPWRLELLPAAAVARAEGKRLFLWSMNGHPLGCT
jgi:hypothetical protein